MTKNNDNDTDRCNLLPPRILRNLAPYLADAPVCTRAAALPLIREDIRTAKMALWQKLGRLGVVQVIQYLMKGSTAATEAHPRPNKSQTHETTAHSVR